MPVSGDDEEIRFIESVIANQRQLQWLQLVLAVTVFVLGIVCVVVAQLFGGALEVGNLKSLGSLGGGFVATLSSIPLKQLYDRRFKISALEFLLARWRRMSGGGLGENEAAELRERFEKMWDLGLAS